MSNLRTKIIQKLVHLNESVFFYPKLKKFYEVNIVKQDVKIIDVGANKGQSIDFYLSIFPNAEFDSFEPNKKLFHYLKSKFKSNSGKLKNIKIHNLGVSDKKGQLVFHENILDETSSFEELNLNSKYLEKKAKILGVSKQNLIVNSSEVEVIKLSDFLNENEGKHFDILKIDVEGHELSCLNGLFVNDKALPITYIQLENHYDDMYKNNQNQKEIEKLLTKNGFKKVKEIKHGFGDFSEVIYKNQHEA